MTPVFADAFYFFALLNPADAAHEDALAFSAESAGPILTTDWILTELADGLADPQNRQLCVEFISELRSRPDVTIIEAQRELFDAGLQLYSERPDKGWSLTDCISFVVMQQKGITEALTGDRHFEQAGFVRLLK